MFHYFVSGMISVSVNEIVCNFIFILPECDHYPIKLIRFSPETKKPFIQYH